MIDVQIRKIRLEEIDELQSISKQTYLEAFTINNSPDNLRQYIEKAFTREQLLSELSDLNARFFFALNEERILGYLKVNIGNSQSEYLGTNHMEVQRIYVKKEFQGNKIGQKLMERAFTEALKNEIEFLWLGVWEHNPGAIRFYKRNGFEKIGTHQFMFGDEEQTDFIMRCSVNINFNIN